MKKRNTYLMITELSRAVSLSLWRDSKTGKYYLRATLPGGKRRKLPLDTKNRIEAELILEGVKKRLKELREAEKTTTEITLSEFIKSYLDHVRLTKEPSTVRSYGGSLKGFESFIKTRLGENVKLSQITLKVIDDFISYLASRGNTKTTINRYLRELKAAFSQAVRWEMIKENPFRKVKPLKEDVKPPKFITVKELEKMLKVTEKERNSDTIKLLLLFGFYTGMRCGELINLRWEDISEDLSVIVVKKAKSHKFRVIPIAERLRRELERIPEGKRVGKVFPWKSKFHISRIVRRVGKKAGVDITLHGLRHSFASNLVMKGVDLKTVQELLGHSDIKVTMIYSHLTPEHLKRAVEKLEEVGES